MRGNGETVFSRRRFIQLSALGSIAALGGCSTVHAESKPVTVLLENNDDEPWEMAVAVKQKNGEEVFRTEEILPPRHDAGMGAVKIDDAFEGGMNDRFTISVWLADESEGTFDYEITCADDNFFDLYVKHEPYPSYNGHPVKFVPTLCN